MENTVTIHIPDTTYNKIIQITGNSTENIDKWITDILESIIQEKLTRKQVCERIKSRRLKLQKTSDSSIIIRDGRDNNWQT